MADAKKPTKAAVVKTVDDLKKEVAEKRNDLLQAKIFALLGSYINDKKINTIFVAGRGIADIINRSRRLDRIHRHLFAPATSGV